MLVLHVNLMEAPSISNVNILAADARGKVGSAAKSGTAVGRPGVRADVSSRTLRTR